MNTYARVKPDDKVDFTPAREMWAKDSAFWNQVNATWLELQRTLPVIKVADGKRIRDLHKAVAKLNDQPPAEAGKWPVRETITGFLAN